GAHRRIPTHAARRKPPRERPTSTSRSAASTCVSRPRRQRVSAQRPKGSPGTGACATISTGRASELPPHASSALPRPLPLSHRERGASCGKRLVSHFPDACQARTMSDHLAIAGVSRTLRTLLRDRMRIPVPVTLAPPDVTITALNDRRVNLYLFKVSEN